MIAQAGIYDDFVAALTAKARETKTGSTRTTTCCTARSTTPTSWRTSPAWWTGPRPHADVTAGGHALDRPGYYYQPTVVAGVHQNDEIVQTEVFGPVITVQKFTTEAEALECANGTEYGLASSVWTSNVDTAARMTAQMDFGCVWINTHIPLIAEMPHGGFKKSGTARTCRCTGSRTTPESSTSCTITVSAVEASDRRG